MKMAVVGSNGFLGTALCRYCTERGWEVYGYDTIQPERLVPDIQFKVLDIIKDDISFPDELDAVFYLAQSPFYHNFPDQAGHLFGVNTYGAVKAATTAQKQGAAFFCYTSTGNVYQPAFHPLNEGHPLRRDDPYALSKVLAEEALALFAKFMTVLIVRPFGLFGPGQTRMLPVKLLNNVLNNEPITLQPSPLSEGKDNGLTISFCSLNDAVYCLERLARLALEKTPLPPVLNLAGPEPISIRRFAATLGEITGIAPVFKWDTSPRAFDLVADISQLRLFMERAFTPFDEAMTKAFGDNALNRAKAYLQEDTLAKGGER